MWGRGCGERTKKRKEKDFSLLQEGKHYFDAIRWCTWAACLDIPSNRYKSCKIEFLFIQMETLFILTLILFASIIYYYSNSSEGLMGIHILLYWVFLEAGTETRICVKVVSLEIIQGRVEKGMEAWNKQEKETNIQQVSQFSTGMWSYWQALEYNVEYPSELLTGEGELEDKHLYFCHRCSFICFKIFVLVYVLRGYGLHS